MLGNFEQTPFAITVVHSIKRVRCVFMIKRWTSKKGRIILIQHLYYRHEGMSGSISNNEGPILLLL